MRVDEGSIRRLLAGWAYLIKYVFAFFELRGLILDRDEEACVRFWHGLVRT